MFLNNPHTDVNNVANALVQKIYQENHKYTNLHKSALIFFIFSKSEFVWVISQLLVTFQRTMSTHFSPFCVSFEMNG